MYFTHAQDRENVDEKPKYFIQVDSQVIKGTPYEVVKEGNQEYHRDDDVEYFNDMTVYEFTPVPYNESGQLEAQNSLLPTIFLLSGGGFVQLDNEEDLNPASSAIDASLSLAKKLANDGFKVIWINYQVETSLNKELIKRLLIAPPANPICHLWLKNEEAKARLEHASLKSFRDFRVKFKNFITNFSTHNIDPNNVFVSGISAGAVLSIYAVFLDQQEIPYQITFGNCNNGTFNINIDANSIIRTQGYPVPPIKGIIPMAGGSLYKNIFNNNLSYTNNVSYNFMHGTCDELINQDTGRFSYKLLNTAAVPFIYNTEPANTYPNLYGSKNLYEHLKQTHSKVGFGQVINGGHSPITPYPTALGVGGWDAYFNGNPPDFTIPFNARNPVYDKIKDFTNSVLGVPGSPAWTNHSYSFFPDYPTTGCLEDDLSLITPPITMPDFVCANTVTATLNPNLPLGATVVWSVSPNLTISGSNTGASVNFTRTSNITGVGTVTAAVTYNGVTINVSKTIAIYPTLISSMYSSVPFVVNGVPQAPLPNLLPIVSGVPTTISFTIPNALQAGITHMEWLSRCGAIISGPTHTWSGNDLTSTITVLYTSGGTCTNMNVRPVNPCGIGGWKSQACQVVAGSSMMVAPNPAMYSLTAIIETELEMPQEGWQYAIIDQVGQVRQSGVVRTKRDEIGIATLPNGLYKLMIYGQEVINASFSVLR